MSLNVALKSSITSLQVNQEALSVISKNLANANSSNYSRRQISQENHVVNGVEFGVKIAQIERATDKFLVEAARRQISEVGKTQSLTGYYDRIALVIGEPGADNSVNSHIDNFFTAITDFSASPEQMFFRQAAIESASTLARETATLASELEQIRFDAEADIKSSIENFNNLTLRLENVNIAITESNLVNADVNNLLDERDVILKELSGIIDLRVSFDSRGLTSISTKRTEILSTTSRSILEYNPYLSKQELINGETSSPIELVTLDPDGNKTNNRLSFVSAGGLNERTHNVADGNFRPQVEFSSGKLYGLLQMRDEIIPSTLDQLDNLAYNLVNSVNAVHNMGVGYPPASELVASNNMSAIEERFADGKFMVTALQADGSPIPSPYEGEETGFNPLVIDLERLNTRSGSGDGVFSMQVIAQEINQYFAPPSSKVSIDGVVDDIKVASMQQNIDVVAASGTIKLIGNPAVGDKITINGTEFTFVDSPSSGTNIEIKGIKGDEFATTAEIVKHLNGFGRPVNDATYEIDSASNNTIKITHNKAGSSGNAFAISVDFSNSGSLVAINDNDPSIDPAGTLINGSDASGLFDFDFEMTNLLAENISFEITAPGISFSDPEVETASVFNSKTIEAGTRQRTATDATVNDFFRIDLTGSSLQEGDVLTITAPIKITEAKTGDTYTETIEFTLVIPDPKANNVNSRFNATAVVGGGNGTLKVPNTNQFSIRASIVGEDGVKLTDEEIADGVEGVLKLESSSGYGIGVSELDSADKGNIQNSSNTQTNRGLSHFFGINNFFTTDMVAHNNSGSNASSGGNGGGNNGGGIKNAAINMGVREDIEEDASLLAMGVLTRSKQSELPDAPPIYTYETGIGNNAGSTIMANLKNAIIDFSETSGISAVSTSFSRYGSEILSFLSFNSTITTEASVQAERSFDGFNDKLKSISGVNIDDELANTIFFQQNYNASARLISIVSELFDSLIESFR